MEGVPVRPAPLQQLWGFCHSSPSPSRPSSSSGLAGLFLTPSSLTAPLFGIFSPFFNPFPQRYHQTLWRGRHEGSAGTFRSLLEPSEVFPAFFSQSPLSITASPRWGGGGAPHLLPASRGPKITQSLCSRSHHQLPHRVLLRLAVLRLCHGSVTGSILSSPSNPAQRWD